MRKNRGVAFFFLLAVACAIGAGFLAVDTVESYKNTEQIVVVVQDIPAYTMIQTKDVTLADVPKVMVKNSHFKSLDEVIGKYTNTFVPKESLLNRSQLSSLESARDGVSLPLSERNESNLRAFGLSSDYFIVLGDEVHVGDHVDIIGTFKDEQDSLAKHIAYGIPVIYKNEELGSYVLAVTPEQAQEISLALSSGNLFITVNPYDFETIPVAETKLSELIGSTTEE